MGKLKHTILGLGLFVATCAFGVVGYLAAGWSVTDAIYMVVITIFGVGYGEVRPVDADGLRIFTSALIVFGYGTAIYAIGGFVQFVAEGEINRALGARRRSMEIQRMRGHVIVCGYGRVGRILLEKLREAEIEVVVIDESAEKVDAATAAGFSTIRGDAAEEATLERAGLAEARMLATVLPSDAANVFVTLTAKCVRDDIPVIARAEDPASELKLERSGAAHVILPAAIGADRIAHLVARPSAETLLSGEFAGRLELGQDLELLGLCLEEMRLPASSPLIGRRLRDIEIGGNHGFLIVGVVSEEGVAEVNPSEDRVLAAGDVVVVMGHADDLPKLKKRYEFASEVVYRGARVVSG